LIKDAKRSLKVKENKDMSIHHQEPRGNTSEFNIEWTPVIKTSETIKWNISKEKFEIHQGLCTRFELHEIMPHCLMVIHKIDGQVGDHENKKLQSYKQVMSRTLSLPLVAVWEQVVTEYNEENPDEEESLGTFAVRGQMTLEGSRSSGAYQRVIVGKTSS
jgi:hypothetical protein